MIFKRDPLKQGYVDWLAKWEWEIFITFSFHHKVCAERAFEFVNQFMATVLKKDMFRKIKFCGLHIFTVSSGGWHHVHSLLLSDHSWPQHFNNLDLGEPNSPLSRIEEQWKHGTCHARPVVPKTEKDLCGYLADQNIYPKDQERSAWLRQS
jgi:hypothetical protein